MSHTTQHENLKKRSLNLRLVIYLVALLTIQCLVAYGAILVFDLLPPSLTGIPDDREYAYNSQLGSINLIRLEVKTNPQESAQQVIERVKPLFAHPLGLVQSNLTFSKDIQGQLEDNGIAYDPDTSMLYATLEGDAQILSLGPLTAPDLLEADPMSIWLYLLLWSLFSVAIFFALLYFAFSDLWHDALNMRNTVEKLGQGKLNLRLPKAKSWIFKPLVNMLNDMTSKIEHLVNNSKIISHAMAHELRTPLMRLRFGLDALEEAQSIEERQEHLKGIHSDIEELQNLINVSLDYFRLQQHKVELHRKPIALKTWLQQLCTSLQPFKPEAFKLSVHCVDTTVHLDETLLNIVIKNLLLNAFKYAKKQVNIQVRIEEDNLVIEVDDDGPGVPIESRKTIFEPYFRLDTSRTRATGGHGLGLAYVKLITEINRGDVLVITSPLHGARFVVRLNIE